MEEIHIFKIPYDVSDNVNFLTVPIHREWNPCRLSIEPGVTVKKPLDFEVKTYRIVRGRKPCQQ